jgi:hypothetical protein
LLQRVQHGHRLRRAEHDVRMFLVRPGPPHLRECLFLSLRLTTGARRNRDRGSGLHRRSLRASTYSVVASDGAVLYRAGLRPAAEPVRAHAARHARAGGRSVAPVRDWRAVFSATSRNTPHFGHADGPHRTAARRANTVERASVGRSTPVRVRAHLVGISRSIRARVSPECFAAASSDGDRHREQVHPTAAEQPVHVTRKYRSRR